MPITQDDIFFESEGNGWYQRNKSALANEVKQDEVMYLLEEYSLKPERVLELGCSNGWRLAKIEQKYKSHCVGVEPSAEAVEQGTQSFPNIKLQRGLISAVPLHDTYDVVIVNFVLHWVGRETLFTALTEIDRLVAEGGYLIIGDFLPDFPTTVPYHHLPQEQVFTYKIDYPQIFTATRLYAPVAMLTTKFDGGPLIANMPSNLRGGWTLLRKSSGEFAYNGLAR